MGLICFRIPKQKGGFTARPIFCVSCTAAIVEQTKTDLKAIEVAVLAQLQPVHV
jgi:hypothetical protein